MKIITLIKKSIFIRNKPDQKMNIALALAKAYENSLSCQRCGERYFINIDDFKKCCVCGGGVENMKLSDGYSRKKK